MKGLPQTLVHNFQFEYLEGPQSPFRNFYFSASTMIY